MLSHKIRYTPDFADEEVEKTLYFNIRLSKMQTMILEEGWDKKMNWAGTEFDMDNMDHRRTLLQFWNDLIRASYGVREDDSFVQDEATTERFMSSAEYDALIEDILYTEDSTTSSKFMMGLFPKKLVEEIKQRGGESEIEERLRELDAKRKGQAEG